MWSLDQVQWWCQWSYPFHWFASEKSSPRKLPEPGQPFLDVGEHSMWSNYKWVVQGADGRGYRKGKIPSDLRRSLPVLGVRMAASSLMLPLQELPSSTGGSLARFMATFGRNLQSRTGQCRIQISCFNWVTQEGLLYLQNSCKDHLRSLLHLYQTFKIYNPSPFKKELNRVIQFTCYVIVLNSKLNWKFNLI